MISIGQDRSYPLEDPVGRSRQPRTDGFHATSQGVCVRCLDQEVHVIRLQRVVDDSEIATLARLAESALEGLDELGEAERRNASADPERDVGRVSSSRALPWGMAHARALARRLPSGACAPAAPPGARRKGES